MSEALVQDCSDVSVARPALGGEENPIPCPTNRECGEKADRFIEEPPAFQSLPSIGTSARVSPGTHDLVSESSPSD